MVETEATFLVLEYPEPCMLLVDVISEEKQALPRGFAYTLELEALETTPCIEQGDIFRFYTTGNLGENSWRDDPKYCEYIIRVNGNDKKKIPPGLLYFDVESAKQGAEWASQTARNNQILKAEMKRNDEEGNFGLDKVWDDVLESDKDEN